MHNNRPESLHGKVYCPQSNAGNILSNASQNLTYDSKIRL